MFRDSKIKALQSGLEYQHGYQVLQQAALTGSPFVAWHADSAPRLFCV
jgi:hypothetical protein